MPHKNTTNPVENGSLFIHGYDVRIRVAHNHLCASYIHYVDGRRKITSYRFNRATSGLKRLVISGDSGFVTLDALRWLQEVGVAFLQVGYDNEILASFSPRGSDYPDVRRWQALAAGGEVGDAITRKLLREKMKGQAETMESVGETALFLSILLDRLDVRAGAAEMRVIEAQMAKAYWQSWQEVELSFARRDRKLLPAHWLHFGNRDSLLASGPRKASNAANAMLNYLYAILKGETITALHAVGLDPGIGIMHADNPATDNLALDVMEPARPLADRWFLDYLVKRTFARREFYEMEDGSVRMRGEVRKELSGIGPACFSWVAPYAEYVRHELEKWGKGRIVSGTPLTQRNRKRAQGKQVRQPAPKAVVVNRCLSCGMATDNGNEHCTDCWPDRRAEIESAFVEESVSRLAKQRAQAANSNGHAPGQGEEANRKRGMTQKEKAEARRLWERENPGRLEGEKVRFENEVQPRLSGFSVRQIAGALEVSFTYATKIRSGEVTPHPVFYEAVEALVAGQKDDSR